MSRRSIEITISNPGRDQGKTFILHEMPAMEGEVWATQAIELIRQARGESAEEGQEGMQALAAKKAKGVSPAVARALQDPSLDGIWKYVEFKPKNAEAPAQKLREDHIEEWRTRLSLRVAFLNFHTDFFSPENPSTSESHTPP